MHSSGGALIEGIALGLGAAVPIGPVNVEIARRVLRGGFWPGFALGCGAVSVDITCAVLSSFGLRPLLQRPAVFWTVTGCGLLVLTYLGVLCLYGAWRHLWSDPIKAGPPIGSAAVAYLAGLGMTATNPMTLAFWFVVVPAAVGSITQEPARDLPMIATGVFAGTLGWVLAFTGVLSWIGRYRRNWWLAAADAAGGATLLGFAAVGLWQALHRIL